MSKISFEASSSGSATYTITSPNSNSNRTIRIPDAGGTLKIDDGTQTSVINTYQIIKRNVASLYNNFTQGQEIPNMTITVTPASASSRFYFMADIWQSGNDFLTFTDLKRTIGGTSTFLGHGAAAGNRPRSMSYGIYDKSGMNTHGTVLNNEFIYVDDPNTTSNITYSVCWRTRVNETCYINRSVPDRDATIDATGDYDHRYTSRMIILELSQ